MNIYLLRHAPVKAPYKNCYNGWIDIDIEPFNKTIKEIKDIKFDKIVSSDLLRCKNTLEMLGYNSYDTDARIREIRFKDFVEGKNFSQLNPPLFALKDSKSWYKYICDESIDDFRERVSKFLDTLKNQNTLICSHGGTIRMIISITQNRDFLKLFDKKIDYLSIIKLSI